MRFSRRHLLQGGAASLAAVGLRHLPAAAQAAGWQADWAKLVAAAEAEGQVIAVVAPNPGQRDFLLQQWKKDFPRIALSLSIHSGAQFVPTVVTERAAGKYLWDIFLSGPNTGFLSQREGLLSPLKPEFMRPDISDEQVWGGWDEAFYDSEKTYLLGLVSDLQSPYYDARAIAPEKAKAQGLKLFLDPAYKGRIVWFEPRREGPGAPFMALIYRVLGPDALWKVMVDQEPFFVSSQPDAAAAIVRGKAALAVSGNARGSLEPFREAGVTFDIRPLGTTPETAYLGTAGSTLGVFDKRPHPNAARLFVNWIMTRDVQAGLSKGQGYDSRRADVPPLDPTNTAAPGLRYIHATGAENDALVRELIAELRRRRPQ